MHGLFPLFFSIMAAANVGCRPPLATARDSRLHDARLALMTFMTV